MGGISKQLIIKAIYAFLVISTVALTSCSHSLCSSYARSEDRVYSFQRNINRMNGARSIQSPYTSSHKVVLQKKYYGYK